MQEYCVLLFVFFWGCKSLMSANSSWNNSRWTRNTLQMALGCSHSRKVGGKQQEFGVGNSVSPPSCPQGLRGILDYETARPNIEPVVLKGHQHPETGMGTVHQRGCTLLCFDPTVASTLISKVQTHTAESAILFGLKNEPH